ncbi:helix-turn-helix transcriptional regulator [Streptococcus caviae]|uniref:helix-turn-helix transcriptional regulator n=1 Tax=Streptococcus sp. 'caviae' TaxID=1915004 RepID=UPI00094B8E21|nr:helix-turn-helix transcriptional regulator [Streptococcus sp. 'caviae']OLN83941.1 transcriptional regulator [Streptococcus sp. 'caviae']
MPKRVSHSNQNIKRLQANLSSLRNIANWTAEDLARRIGVTKQTISNLETSDGKTNQINPTQYLAIRSVIDNEIISSENPILREAMNHLFSQEHGAESETKDRISRDLKIAQLGAASKAAYLSQPKDDEQTEMERRAMAVFALLPLTSSILGTSSTVYKTFSFFNDITRQ